ncbi:recombinase family protein [Intestinimonas sp. HCP28S3_D6]|uniref:recombinase family protein n=1 Tax=Intestinimonas sp. HCP28S3_D6 TaxID=3438942 RepID=UPI003F8BFF83
MSRKKQVYEKITALYCRISLDDGGDNESMSISNQKIMLRDFAEKHGMFQYEYYVDDGYTGRNFNRPSFQRMIADIEAGKIGCVITKDLSRLGRNYIEAGSYIEIFFPKHNVRYMAITDGVDSLTRQEMDITPFKNILNEFYSRDTSKKVKAVKKACAENGKFMGTYPAYGYKRNPADKHHLVIDEDTAPIVRRIFEMRAAGTGFHAIAVTLNEEGIPSPGVLYYQRKGQSDPRRVNHKWADQTVKNIVRSEVYIGNMVQGKTGTLSYKSRKLVGKPEEEWIRVEGTHEPIISQELWDTVVSIDKKKVRKSSAADGYKSIFTGLVYCADCGFKMRNQVERFTYKDGTPGRYSSFICGNYSRSGKGACTIHTIYENVLSQLVLEDIREKARFAEYDPEQLVQQIIRLKDKEAKSRLSSCEQELKTYTARLSDLERLMQNLYEDKCAGTIPQTVFQTLMHKYEAERAEKSEAIPELERKVKSYLENRTDANRWLAIIRRYTEITELDESILFELVDRIEVGETKKVGGQRVCDLRVYYRYVGNVDAALARDIAASENIPEERRLPLEEAI